MPTTVCDGHDEHADSVAESGDARMDREAKHGDVVARRLVRDSQRPAESCARLDELALPADFAMEVMAMVGIHVAIGNWDQAKASIDACAERWRTSEAALESARAAIHDAVNHTEKLAWHVTSLLDQRTVNEIERHCNGTVGALLEVFPRAFVNCPGCGPYMVERIAKTLSRIGVIDAEEAAKRMAEWKEAMSDSFNAGRFPNSWQGKLN